ncbi:MAG: ABC transporter substrate-binding protein [Chloroflexota bacterium]
MTNITRPMTRRAAIQGAVLAVGGLAGAALLGCGSKNAGEAGGLKMDTTVTAQTGVDILPLTAPVASGSPKKGGTFNYATGVTTFTQHDAHTALGAAEWHMISEKTLELHPVTGELLPSVATSWEVADPRTLVFKIKPGIKMHNVAPWNGRDFTAQDVAWNLERIGGLYAERLKQPVGAFQRASMVQNLVKAEAVDATTVKVTLSSPNSAFFKGVADTRVMLMPKEMDDIGFSDPMKFGGIGAFQMAEYTKDVRERFKRFDGYSGFRGNEPWFDESVLTAIPDRASTIAAFASGQSQFVISLTPDEITTIRKSKPEALLYTWIDSNWNHFRPNMAYEPFKDVRVRKAIQLAIDYAAIGDGEFGPGWGYQAALCPGFAEAWKPDKVRSLPGFNPATKAEDRKTAQQLLTAAGYPNGKGLDFDMTYTTPNDRPTRFQSQMLQVFPELKFTLKGVDATTFATQQAASNFKTVSYTITAAPDPVIDMSSNYSTGGSRNYGKFSNAELDALLDKARGELNNTARTALFETFQQKFVDEWVPMWVLHAWATRDMVQANIGGFDKAAGTWFGYGWYTKQGKWFYTDK